MSRKLQLDADALRVESFPVTSESARGAGTVHGHESWTLNGKFTCYPNYTCPECATPPTE